MVVRPYKHVVSPTPKGKETIANNLFLSLFRVLGIPWAKSMQPQTNLVCTNNNFSAL